MTPDDAEVAAILGRAMVARIASRSARGTPQMMPLWFVRSGGALRMTNGETSPTVHNIAADPKVVILFEAEREGDHRCLRLAGRARFRKDRRAMLSTVVRELIKYHLAPASVWGMVRHPGNVPSVIRYYIERRDSGVIEFSPEHAEMLRRP